MTEGSPRFNWYRHVIVPSLLGTAVLAALALYSGAGEFAAQVGRLPLRTLPLILGLALANYLLRYLRWVFYLRRLERGVGLAALFRVFFAGLTMSASPGKVGELIKALWLNSLARVPVPRAAAAVLMERLMDVLAIAVLSLGALSLVTWSPPVLAVVVGGPLLLVVALAATPLARRWLSGFLRRPWLARMAVAYDAFRSLAGVRPIAVAAPLGVVAWLCEGLALWFILGALDVHLPAVQAVGIYAFATLAGAVSMLPGGLGSTEAVLVGLLVVASVPVPLATTATLLVRAATLWFALLLGMAFVPLLFRDLRVAARKAP